jgi:hypothetical protein
MRSAVRIFCSVAMGAVLWFIGGLLAYIAVALAVLRFAGPDKYPHPLYAGLLVRVVASLCAFAGFALGWKVTARWAQK